MWILFFFLSFLYIWHTGHTEKNLSPADDDDEDGDDDGGDVYGSIHRRK